MAAGSTYTPIATTTLGSAQATVTFSSISGSYTDLVLIVQNSNANGVNSISLNFNSDTSSNYSMTFISGDGSTASSSRETSETKLNVGATTTSMGNVTICNIMNYSNSTTYKSTLSRSGWTGYDLIRAFVGLWRSTSAITQIDIKVISGANFNTGSTFTLYGIAAA